MGEGGNEAVNVDEAAVRVRDVQGWSKSRGDSTFDSLVGWVCGRATLWSDER